MDDGIMLIIGADGVARSYDDTYGITIHCENREEWDEVRKILEKIPHWIPVTERFPEAPFGCIVTVLDTDPITMDEFENILPDFVGWDGEQWNDGDGEQCPFEVIAWMPLPEPYQGGEQDGGT